MARRRRNRVAKALTKFNKVAQEMAEHQPVYFPQHHVEETEDAHSNPTTTLPVEEPQHERAVYNPATGKYENYTGRVNQILEGEEADEQEWEWESPEAG